MKNIIILLAAVAVLGGVFYFLNNKDQTDTTANTNKDDTTMAAMPEITPISHASFIMDFADTVIYNDPVGGAEAYAGQPPAELVLISDNHGDHLNIETLEAVVGDAPIYAPQVVYDELTPALQAQTQVINNGEVVPVPPFSIEAVPMYNLPEQGIEIRHEPGRGNGYILESDGVRVYIAGDTAGTPEMRALTDIDIAFVPMNLPYTMSVEDAADAVLAFAPKEVIPYHYRTPDGFSDVDTFESLVAEGNPEINVRRLAWYDTAPEAADAEADASEGAAKSFDVDSFSFGYSMDTITVSEGDTVTINLTNSDGFHDWVVDEFDAATEKISAGGSTSVTFVADKAGSYEFYCSVGSHRANGMVGTLIVE